MSAPPPPGNPPANAPNGAPKSQKANPLRPLRRNPRGNPLVARRPPPRPAGPSGSGPQNGTKPSIEEVRRQNGGWSEAPPPKYNDIPIMTTKKEILAGIRYHMMKFTQSKVGGKPVDPTDQDEFARPVTLHRRDARQPPPGRAVKTEAPEAPQADEQEAERQAQIKAEREAQRAIDQAKIAPVAKDPNPKRPKKQKEEKTTFNRAPKTEAAKKESDIRYEEALPWHLEDAEGKNVWVGNYVSALSESNVAFMIDGSVFRMIPLEKWYRFTSKPPFQPYTIDEAEALMNKKVDVGRWVMKDEEKRAGRKDLEETRRMFYGGGQMVKTESATFKAASRSEKLDHDEIDMSGDEFQDDDEAPMFEKNDDEDTKDSKERIRREQLGANLFGEGDEQEVDKELSEQLREEILRQKLGKTTKKALIKRDREDIYESDDSEENPWSSSSDDNSSEEEEEEDKKDDEKKDASKDDKTQSGAGSKGTNTPSGKKPDGSKKSKSLKRAGSPALSESSGNESSRKKLKKNVTSAAGSRSGTPLLQGGPRRPTAAGSGSDGEATAGEMSDGAAPKRKKLNLVSNSARGTPSASRAGSPNPTQGAASPGSSGTSNVEPSEILDKIPAEGITVNELIKLFNHRLGDRPGQMSKNEWIQLVKKLCDYGPDKRLRRRS
ncbi:transcription initiation factor TFIIF subunit alpha [Fusarium beomiforme]|uniref:Transcription initiation factor IIF subunit alpha n=1 Tax=Fusarium beomiforme TaxID=44412 RepID=A0A9P5AFC3_9HYPO|nr:transcription initiation factor TFIIF subunit alpha [Fusarium beomiforme]